MLWVHIQDMLLFAQFSHSNLYVGKLVYTSCPSNAVVIYVFDTLAFFFSSSIDFYQSLNVIGWLECLRKLDVLINWYYFFRVRNKEKKNILVADNKWDEFIRMCVCVSIVCMCHQLTTIGECINVGMLNLMCFVHLHRRFIWPDIGL